MGKKQFGGSLMSNFSENPLNLVLLLVLIILVGVFIYYVFLWWKKQQTVTETAASDKKPKTVSFAENVEKPTEKKAATTVEGFSLFSRY